jgi:hypothetical protein
VLILAARSLVRALDDIVTSPARAGRGGVRRSLEELATRGWARPDTGEAWILTPQGRAEAERMAGQREA